MSSRRGVGMGGGEAMMRGGGRDTKKGKEMGAGQKMGLGRGWAWGRGWLREGDAATGCRKGARGV